MTKKKLNYPKRGDMKLWKTPKRNNIVAVIFNNSILPCVRKKIGENTLQNRNNGKLSVLHSLQDQLSFSA